MGNLWYWTGLRQVLVNELAEDLIVEENITQFVVHLYEAGAVLVT